MSVTDDTFLVVVPVSKLDPSIRAQNQSGSEWTCVKYIIRDKQTNQQAICPLTLKEAATRTYTYCSTLRL